MTNYIVRDDFSYYSERIDAADDTDATVQAVGLIKAARSAPQTFGSGGATILRLDEDRNEVNVGHVYLGFGEEK